MADTDGVSYAPRHRGAPRPRSIRHEDHALDGPRGEASKTPWGHHRPGSSPSAETSDGRRERFLEELTVDRINEITQKTAGHYARVIDLVGCGREADLPFPRELTELAYLKGIVICTDDEKHRALLISMYSTLEDIMLTNDEYAIMVEYNAMIRKSGDKEWMENITDKDLAAFMDLGPGGCFPFGIRTRVGLIEGRSNAGRRPCSILHIPAMQTDRYCRDIRVAGLLMIT